MVNSFFFQTFTPYSAGAFLTEAPPLNLVFRLLCLEASAVQNICNCDECPKSVLTSVRHRVEHDIDAERAGAFQKLSEEN
jgi:hypothetical protein